MHWCVIMSKIAARSQFASVCCEVNMNSCDGRVVPVKIVALFTKMLAFVYE